MTSRLRTLLVRCLQLGAGAALLATLLALLGPWHWTLGLFTPFRAQYGLALAFATLSLALLKSHGPALAALLGAGLNAWALSPLFLAVSTPAARPSQPLRLVTHNLLYTNQNHPATVAWLRQTRADVVFLSEVTQAWSASLRSLHDLYPHQHHAPRTGAFGCALLSRHPWTHLTENPFPETLPSTLAVQLTWQGAPRLLLGLHPPPPTNPHSSRLRHQTLAAAATFLATHPVRSQLLIGDLNATPWCHPFRLLLARTSLRDSAAGRGWQPTWNLRSLFLPIPIDHLLISPDLGVTARHLGPDLGSDHRPVLADLQPFEAQ